MHLALRFWTRLVLWTGILLVIFLGLGIGQGMSALLAHIPAMGGLALVLAAYPAGLAVAGMVLPDGRPAVRPLVQFTLAAAAVCVLTLVLAGYVGPAVQGALAEAGEPAGRGAMDSGTLTLGQLRTEIRAAVQRAQSNPGGDTIAGWLDANSLAWDYLRRTDGSALPLLFGWIGVLTGFWSRLTMRNDLRQAQHWAMGLFLVMSTYLAGENSYELIVLRAAGPVAFAGDFILIVPMLLVFGLGWPAALTLWKRHTEVATT